MRNPCDVIGLGAAIALLAGCAAGPAATSSTVQVAAADQVSACRYLDDVTGTSGWYGVNASRGVESARAEALTKAEGLGATHIVWGLAPSVHGATTAAGKAYRCP